MRTTKGQDSGAGKVQSYYPQLECLVRDRHGHIHACLEDPLTRKCEVCIFLMNCRVAELKSTG